eukprot:1161130-Pelagomonas_calceolata.AAC.3
MVVKTCAHAGANLAGARNQRMPRLKIPSYGAHASESMPKTGNFRPQLTCSADTRVFRGPFLGGKFSATTPLHPKGHIH